MPNNTNNSNPTPQSLRSFFIIWIGQAFSLLGSRLVQFALIWWLARSTNSATVLAFASLVALLPQVIIGPFAGTLVDRWNRRIVIMSADAAIALATVLLAVLFSLDIVQTRHIYALIFIRAVGEAFHWPAMQASTTMMVPKQHLSRVAGLNQTLLGISNIIMPLSGAVAIEALPMQGVLTIDVATALIAIIPLLFISIPQPVRKEAVDAIKSKFSMLTDMREGLYFIWSWKALLIFSVIGILSNMLGRPAAALMPLMVTQHFGGDVLELGWLQAAVGLGSILGGIILGIWGGFKRHVITVMLALALDGIAILIFGLTPASAFLLAAVSIFAVGFLESIVLGLNGAIFQAVVPPEMQGRVFSLLISVAQLATPLGLAIAGPVANVMGVQFWWVAAGITITMMGVGSFFIPAVMRIEDGPEPDNVLAKKM